MTDSLADLDLGALRARRDEVRAEESAVSYRRRLLQAQLDIVATYGREGGQDAEHLVTRLAAVLSDQPSGAPGPARAMLTEVDGIDAPDSLPDDLPRMSVDERAALTERLATAESALSEHRRELLDRLDTLQDELVTRYRDGGVDTAALLEGGGR